MENINKDSLGIILRKIFYIVLGNFFCSIAINVFFVPNGMLSGGVGGIAILLKYIAGLPIGTMVFLINIPIFIFGSFKLDKKFLVYSLVSIFLYSFILNSTSWLVNYIKVDDIFLAAIFGAVFNGIGMGLMFKNGVNQGGFDIIALIAKKERNMNIGTALMAANTIVITSSSIYLGIKPAMYTLISMFVGYQIVDRVQIGFSMMKNIIIVSNRSDELSHAIMEELGRGVTFFKGQGAYTQENKNIIYCTLVSREIAKLKEIVERIDPEAFFTINEAVEVQGSGFKRRDN